jgi:hypothetical protein
MNYRNCENCKACYSTGKDYGNSWCELPNPDVETKGLCEICNEKSTWYINPEKCYSLVVNSCSCGKVSVHSGLVCGANTKEEHMQAYHENRKK